MTVNSSDYPDGAYSSCVHDVHYVVHSCNRAVSNYKLPQHHEYNIISASFIVCKPADAMNAINNRGSECSVCSFTRIISLAMLSVVAFGILIEMLTSRPAV